MSAESIQIILNKISTIYTEQIWAVTIFSAMSGFIINKAKYLVETLDHKILRRGIKGTTILCTLFVVIRFVAYWKYEKILDNQLVSSGIHPITNPFSELIALLFGTIFYLTIIVTLFWITLKVIGKEIEKSNN